MYTLEDKNSTSFSPLAKSFFRNRIERAIKPSLMSMRFLYTGDMESATRTGTRRAIDNRPYDYFLFFCPGIIRAQPLYLNGAVGGI